MKKSHLFTLVTTLALAGAALAQETIPLPAVLPKPNFIGTPSDAPAGANVEKPLGRPRPIPQVPKGTVNLALKKKVTASKAPYEGSLDLITDGVKDAKQGSAVEMYPKLQWVQVDLEAA